MTYAEARKLAEESVTDLADRERGIFLVIWERAFLARVVRREVRQVLSQADAWE